MAINADAGDHELIAAAQRGERAALEAFVRRHDRWVRGVVYATLGSATGLDDVVQHVWTTVWQQIRTLVDPLRWRGWLCTLARNAALDVGEKAARERRRRRGSEVLAGVPANEDDPARQAATAEEHRRALQAIGALPDLYRVPFVLRHVQGWSYAEIGEALDLPVDTVETRLVRARRMLRATLTTGPRDDETSAAS
jgi:RNA polymerase sigma-70 factor, ECF subfamily